MIIRYDPDLPERHHRALKQFVDTKDPPYAIAAPDPEQAEPLPCDRRAAHAHLPRARSWRR